MTDAQWTWLMVEGIIPLFGAGVLYLLLGCAQYVAYNSQQAYKFAWLEAIDSPGWLYGGLILSVQSSLRSFTSSAVDGPIKWGSVAASCICLLVLFCVMIERGRDQNYRPPVKLKCCASLLVFAILFVGCKVQGFVPLGASK